MRRNAVLLAAPQHQFSQNILKSHSFSLLLHPLPSIDRGTTVSSCFLAIWAEQCMLADLIGTFSLHCKMCWRLDSAQCLFAPVLSNNELRGAIGRCLFDAADTVMPLCGVSKWSVCSRVHAHKGWEKAGVCFGRKIVCQRSGFNCQNLPNKPAAVSVLSVQPLQQS